MCCDSLASSVSSAGLGTVGTAESKHGGSSGGGGGGGGGYSAGYGPGAGSSSSVGSSSDSAGRVAVEDVLYMAELVSMHTSPDVILAKLLGQSVSQSPCAAVSCPLACSRSLTVVGSC